MYKYSIKVTLSSGELITTYESSIIPNREDLVMVGEPKNTKVYTVIRRAILTTQPQGVALIVKQG